MTAPLDGPLDGIVVLDLTQALAGPHATMILGDLGARVIKVERAAGDDSRAWGPPWVGEDKHRVSTYFLSANRNKESVVLDLKAEADLDVLWQLVDAADVLVENFRPGVLDRMGLTVEALHARNPRLVVCSISGFGHDGPEGGRPGYDQIAQGEAGLMSLTGPGPDEPTKVGVPIGDLLAGLHAVYGILAALHARHTTGRGDVVRTSLLSSLVGVHAYQGTRYTVAGQVPRAQGNHHPSIAPYGAFACSDGMLQIAAANDSLWRRTAAVAGVDADDPRFATNGSRVEHRDELIALLEAAFADRTRDDLLAALDEAGVPSGAIRTLDEVYTSPQVRSQGLLLDVEHPALGALQLPGPPVRFDSHARADHAAPPSLGADGPSVLAWLASRSES
ncbi:MULTISPECIES: CaiB/BaiF CoA transferase family protein [unclassified Nocardioides]|uniref:CaiB/BaiF CoA transferase family protein n=1 Tax=unclassified Nocardioides TaxID=2615069 RepID=UPI003014A420